GPLSGMRALPAEVLSAQLAEAAHAGALVEKPRSGLAFSHGLIRDTIYAELSAQARASLHLAAAETLERRHAGDPTAPLLTAPPPPPPGPAHPARAAAAPRPAGPRALADLAFEDAAAILVRALGAHAEALPGDALGRAELLLALADARIRTGDVLGGRAACRD